MKNQLLFLALTLFLLPGALRPLTAQADSVKRYSPNFERTEVREDCAGYDALRRPFFGDLHVHTSYSFDSYISSQRN
ncbi:MAG: DUF3604 domain-containing protein, partial [Deltaproteobacteria bacterium]|nr:DUF3604 domain-containing protein [Deltaproteobacteria bacterium]